MTLAANASASSITYDTTSPLTGFNSTPGDLTLIGTGFGGGSATLVWSGIPIVTVGDGNVALGEFNLTCVACTNSTPGTAGATFGAFTADLYVDDDTDGGVGEFIGTSAGGTVYNDSSTITINWITPPSLEVGPGTLNAVSGTFSTSFFIVDTPTPIVAQNTNSGITTVQGQVESTLAPEPATMAMAGSLLIGLAALARKRRRS
jgi:hypothetical protein